MPTHRLFIDESGTKEYARDGVYGPHCTRYLVFGSVLLAASGAEKLEADIAALKAAIFGDANPELKSHAMRRPDKRRRLYLEPFGITEERFERFVADLYSLVGSFDLSLIATAVDKVQMVEKYPVPWYPSAVAYELLLQRVEYALHGKGTVAVTIDDMTGATPKRNQYKANLRSQHEMLRAHGSRLPPKTRYTTIEGRLRFLDSRRSNVLQVADVVAYNVFRQFSDHGDAWETRGPTSLPMYEHFRRVVHKFRTGSDGRIAGFGIVKFPAKDRIPWRVRSQNK